MVRISREKSGPGVDPISAVVAAGGRAKEVLDLRLWDALVASALCGQGKLSLVLVHAGTVRVRCNGA